MVSKNKKIITKLLLEKYENNFENEIKNKSLYLRISLIGECNLKCKFCHNEGGPKRGELNISLLPKILKTSKKIGFKRVQFTGGEPLLNPKVNYFVECAKRYFNDVGITTNGIILKSHFFNLMKAGINRIHVSIPPHLFKKNNEMESLNYLNDLIEIHREAMGNDIKVRINLPLSKELLKNDNMIYKIMYTKIPIMLLTLLDYSKNQINEQYEDNILKAFCVGYNHDNVSIRSYFTPNGIRCKQCDKFAVCREQSRSLRLGVDNILRPCLSSREWDIKISNNDLYGSLKTATALALDY